MFFSILLSLAPGVMSASTTSTLPVTPPAAIVLNCAEAIAPQTIIYHCDDRGCIEVSRDDDGAHCIVIYQDGEFDFYGDC